MPFEYSCFISYRHCNGEKGKSFINQLYEALSDELELWTDKEVFLDKERLQAGYFYNEVLAEELCRSVCLIVVFTPTYFNMDHTYCTREYKAMEQLEEERLRLLGNIDIQKHGLIIPIIFRGEDYLPPEIKDRRQYVDFQRYSLQGPVMKQHPEFDPEIRKIAEYIAERCRAFESVSEDPCKDCSVFVLPTDDDVQDFLEGIKQYRQAFPGR